MQAKKRGIISDPELIEQFADDPEALAVLDAIAATQSRTLLGRSLLQRAKVQRAGRRRYRAEVSGGNLAHRLRHRPAVLGAVGLAALIAAVAASLSFGSSSSSAPRLAQTVSSFEISRRCRG
jgi:hypothetical protein